MLRTPWAFPPSPPETASRGHRQARGGLQRRSSSTRPLVPDEVILGIVRSGSPAGLRPGLYSGRLPPDIPQAEAMEEGLEIDEVLSIEADDQLIIERLSGDGLQRLRRQLHVARTPCA